MSNERPSGLLMAGGIGSFLHAIGLLIMLAFGAAGGLLSMGGGAGEARTAGGIMILFGLLVIAGGICQGLGFFGLKKLFGGLNSLAGFLAILLPVALILLLVTGIMMMVGMLMAMTYLFAYSWAASLLVPGIALLGNKGKTQKAGWTYMIGGALLVIAGIVLAAIFTFGILKINIGLSIVQILSYVLIFGAIAGHALCGIAMMSERN